jgi:hypothetical protein
VVFPHDLKWLTVTACLLLGKATCLGFSLVGPYADWMQKTNGYHQPGDIGGPMDIGQGYRWNVPVVTYGFDKNFLDYFGSNGVAAVEGAIQILNDLPSASAIVLTNFPTYAARMNFTAAAEHLFDLKTATLPLLLEQMGLAPPMRNIFDLRKFAPILMWTDESTWPTGTIPNLIIERNFDPETLLPSHYVNGNIYVGMANALNSELFGSNAWDVSEFTIDPGSEDYYSAVADWRTMEAGYPFSQPATWFLGYFCENLTRDDVGGLRYLLSTNNIQRESLLPDVHGTGTNAGAYVNLAQRPGVEKITFVRQQYDSSLGQPIPVTNQFTDTYISNNVVNHQLMERVVMQPDFLFSADEFGVAFGMAPGYTRTGTSNWWNSANAAGNTNAGPGVIRPQVKITFGKRGPFVESIEGTTMLYDYEDFRWASFDGSITPPVIYPESPKFVDANRLTIHLNLIRPDSRSQIIWHAPVAFWGQVVLQTSTNFSDWVSVIAVMNHGGAVDWDYWYPQQPQRFFRAVPQ